MELLHDPQAARNFVKRVQQNGERVAVVPTMGALHEGHLSLVRLAKLKCDRAVATIFVNPTQFAPGEDLDKYPRTLDQDLEQLQQNGVDAVFVPEVSTMYPAGCTTSILPPRVAEGLEGEIRPEHFGGVCTIVLKLLQCLPCDAAVFGEKDFQQLRVIESMVEDFNLPIKVIPGEIVRDPDGLAMSSRNRYLTSVERSRALAIPRSLDCLVADVANGIIDVKELQRRLELRLMGDSDATQEPKVGGGRLGVDSIDYAVLADANQLRPIDSLDQPSVALIAARVGETRLIDNRVIGVGRT